MTKNKSRKVFAATASTALVASAIVPAATFAADANFPDVVKGSWYEDAVNYLAGKNILQGDQNGYFNPRNDINRASAAEVLAKAKELPVTGKIDFPDVDPDAWYYNSILAATNAGYFEGDDHGNFNPKDPLTREQAATIIVRAFDLSGGKKTSFKDNDKIGAWAKDAVEIAYANDVIEGKPDGTFAPKENVDRASFAVMIKRAIDKVNEAPEVPKIESVSAINAKQAKVTFKGALPEGVDFSNFEIDGGLTVTDAEVSADRKTVTITVNEDFVRNQEYTVTTIGIVDKDGKEYPETSGKFTWAVAEGVTVAFTTTTLDQGEETGLSVKDKDGKEVKNAEVKVTSFNENLVKVQNPQGQPEKVKLKANENGLSGVAEVEVKTTLPDGSKLTHSFNVTVKEEVVSVENAGYTLLTSDAFNATGPSQYANTEAFKKYATAVTSLVEGTEAVNIYAFDEKNKDPEKEHVNFDGSTRVNSSNPIVATAALDGENIKVTPLKAGKTTVSVTLEDGTRKSFPVEVTAKPVMKDITVDATTVKLSDVNVNNNTTFEEGVNSKTIQVTALDQFKKPVANNADGATPKVTVSSGSDGLTLVDTDGDVIDKDVNIFSGNASTANFVINAKKDTPVKDATVKVSYFADKDDSKPISEEKIKVNVVDIENDADTVDIEVVAPSDIDANYEITQEKGEIDFTVGTGDVEIYALDNEGNRTKTASNPTLSTTANDDSFVSVADNDLKVKFTEPNNALTYLRGANTINVDVKTEDVTKRLPITYKNTAIIPNKASVSNNAISIDLEDENEISIKQILFGVLDKDQLIFDDASSVNATDGDNIISVKNVAKNSGYLYNKPAVTITGTDGKVMPVGANLYGSEIDENANWNNKIVNALVGYKDTEFAVEGFDLDVSIANHNGVGTVDTTNGVVLDTDKTATFTLVVNGIYTEGSVSAIEGKDIDNASSAEKARHNLLESPVYLNVSVSNDNPTP